MANIFRVVAAGVTAAILATAVGCSQVSEPEASVSSDNASEQATEPGDEGNTTEAESAQNATETGEAEYRTVENVTLPAPGSDPMAMVFELREFDGETVGSDQIRVSYPEPDRAVVLRTVRGLPDDSVSALRTRYVFEPVEGEQNGKLWQIVQVSEQNKCRAGRGPEDWSAETCS